MGRTGRAVKCNEAEHDPGVHRGAGARAFEGYVGDMTANGRLIRAIAIALVLAAPTLSCKRFLNVFTPHGAREPSPYASPMEGPLPLHTGGLDVLGSGPAGQGPGPSPASQGNPIAGGIAAGVGAVVFGATAVKTVASCTAPNASPRCLRGPGPADVVADAGAP